MNQWRSIPFLLMVAAVLSFAPHQAGADEIFYCYREVEINFNATSAPEEFNKILDDITEYPDEYDVALNLTKNRIDYNDIHASGDDWVEAAEVKVEGSKWIMTSPVVYYFEATPEIIIVYFNKENLQYTELGTQLQDYSEPEFSNPDLKGHKSYVITSGRCRTKNTS